MSKKIQFHTFHLLFRFFSYLADKSGGWSMFVRPKLVIGGVIVGLGISTSNISFANVKSLPQKKIYNSSKKRRAINKGESQRQNRGNDVTVGATCYTSINEEKKVIQKSVLSDTVIYGQTKTNEFREPVIIDSITESLRGIELMQKLVSEIMVYPSIAIKKKIEGTVVCSFIIDKKGILKDIEVIKSVHPLLDTEAKRTLYLLPNWSPGQLGNRTIVVKYTLPIRFSLPLKKQ